MVWEVGPTDDETMKRRRFLAQSIQDDLVVAGLPVVPAHGFLDQPGVHVTVDAVHDESGGGVYVHWAPHYVLRTASTTATMEGRGQGHPAVNHNGAASRAMQDAIAEILTAAGYTVVKDYSDLAPFQMKVVNHTLPSPSWRDWLEARRDELTETMKATYRREHPER